VKQIIAIISLSSLFNFPLIAQQLYHEQYRPQVHFSPREKWTNDPNGMVYYKGIYHLFFQHYPDSTVWGPMHWGHAISKDLIHWKQEPIALFPDSLGYIFSGSAVVDYENTSGFGKNGQIPLVAIFTHHDPNREKRKRNDFQNQSVAYSLDDGKTWTKYADNPVLKNPGIRDFRDPKVMWYAPEKKWVMTLATSDRVTFFSSHDLKLWVKESDFGSKYGAHGGGWECPDLFTLDDQGKKIWVLIANLNPGGPNKGSGTQYFLGHFDGKTFTPIDSVTRWIDYGPDDYAGITWSNTGNRKIFLGWMSNWKYANLVPSVVWRNAMTIPRELTIIHIGDKMYVTSQPVSEISEIESKSNVVNNFIIQKNFDLADLAKEVIIPYRIRLELPEITNFSLLLTNDSKDTLTIGYDKMRNQYFIDRRSSGKVDFQKDFPGIHVAPRISVNPKIELELIVDVSSVELFADKGVTSMTEIVFPSTPYQRIKILTTKEISVNKLEYTQLTSIWPQ
jgi:fructan beta-fructosidase